MFSIVIPTYKRATYLLDCLNSIPWNSEHLHEVIIISDGSPDQQTVSVSQLFKGATLLTIPHAGPSAARNAGIMSATGTYIVFLDDDDLLLPWSLDIFAKAVSAALPPIIFSKPHVFDLKSTLSVRETEYDASWFKDYYASSNEWCWWGTSSFVIKNSLCKHNLFREDLFLGEDAEFIMRIGCSNPVLQIHSPPTFCYRMSTNSITSDACPKQSFDFARCLVDSERRSLFPGGNARSAERIKIINRHVAPVILSLSRSLHPIKAFIIYCKAFSLLIRGKRIVFTCYALVNLICVFTAWPLLANQKKSSLSD